MSPYLIEFCSGDEALSLAGFEVCLAITALDLGLDIIVDTSSSGLLLKLRSLADYGVAKIYIKTALTSIQYQNLIQRANFLLVF